MNEENKMVVDSQWPAEKEQPDDTVFCPICEREIPEEDMLYAVCDSCISRNTTWDTVLTYGAHSKATVEINALFAKLLSADQINEALLIAATNMRKEYPGSTQAFVHETVSDDPDDFAHWLIEQKGE